MSFDEITILVVASQDIQEQHPPIIELLEDQYLDLLERFRSIRCILRTILPSNWSQEYDDTFLYTSGQGPNRRFELLEHPTPMNLE